MVAAWPSRTMAANSTHALPDGVNCCSRAGSPSAAHTAASWSWRSTSDPPTAARTRASSSCTAPSSGCLILIWHWKPLPNLFLRCWMEPRQRRRPPTMIPTRVHTASTSSMLCVVRMMDVSCRSVAARASTRHMNRRAIGSIPVDASSMKSSGGLPSMAMATDSLRLLPPLRVPARRCSNSDSCISCSLASTSSRSRLPEKPLMRANSSRCSRTVSSSSSAENCGQ
mmetsp:Transcript_9793/g.30808  ORF Transcript_9793/g.30808 Transcript_9793/m.30808 type:complete len:226 (+) Transcript_9793:620-1297(+)